MIDPKAFLSSVKSLEVNFFTGVPDSLLKEFCACIEDLETESNHIINVNEGGAVSLAIGYNLATNKIPLVYLQNSGLGNTINPLLSLADEKVYSIPMLLVIGWRGEPGVKDEPQHIKQGAVQNELLKAMNIDYEIIDNTDTISYVSKLDKLVNLAKEKSRPVALVVKKGAFKKYQSENKPQVSQYTLNRENVLKTILSRLEDNAIIVSTTGKTSREIFEIRKELNQSNEKDFLTVGGMGHCSQIALGIAIQKKDRPVYCFDGDGASLMHLGANAIIGTNAPQNFKHILLNNGAHESVGGQPTVGFIIDFQSIAKACRYKASWSADTISELDAKFNTFQKSIGPCLLEIKLISSSRSDLGRPTKSPLDNKKAFMNWIK
jgi:phosphonopyruvate decarboxylase